MAKITDLAAVDAITGDEFLPIVQGNATKRATMGALRALIVPFLQQWYKGDKGDAGGADAFRPSLAALRAAPITDGKSDYAGGTWYWSVGDYTGQVDDTLVVASDHLPVTAGAWVRQTDKGVALTHPLGAPVYAKLLGDLIGQTVPVTLFCAANGSRDDGQNFQELLNKKPAQIEYAPGREVATSRQIMLRSNCRHAFQRGSGVLADTPEFGLFGLGLTSGNLGDVQAPIVRRSKDMQLINTSGEPLKMGDMLLITDLSDPTHIINEPAIVQVVNGSLIRVRDKFNVDMPNPAKIRVYKIYDPLTNLHFDGPGRISNVHAGGGGVRISHARDVRFRKMLLEEIRYIGLAIENTIGFRGMQLSMRDIEASGIGMRASKGLHFSDIFATEIKSDEAFTAFENVMGVNVDDMTLHQYLFGDDADGGGAGNNVLLDKLCADFHFHNLICRGSATYNVFFNDRTENVTLSGFTLGLANLGGIRIANTCRNITIGNGHIEDVVNLKHEDSGFGQASGQPCAAIMIDPSNTGCGVSGIVTTDRIASGRALIDRQPVADRVTSRVPKLAAGVETPAHSVSGRETIGAQSGSYQAGASGKMVTLGADEERTYVQARDAGDTVNRPLQLQPFGGTVAYDAPEYASNADAYAAGMRRGEIFCNTSANHTLQKVV